MAFSNYYRKSKTVPLSLDVKKGWKLLVAMNDFLGNWGNLDTELSVATLININLKGINIGVP
jgi:hypothetical protein